MVTPTVGRPGEYRLRVAGDMREALGKRFVAGVALSMGSHSYTYEERLRVMSLDGSWRTVP
ncbi:MAG: hypothetical protein M0Z92_11735 [Actinomycetota bacterium]|nr:hypothetical protein [Actinomycetota bacterium]